MPPQPPIREDQPHTPTDAKWSHFKPPRRSQCKPPLRPLERRLLNQTFFKRILVGEEGTIEDVELTPVYAALAAWEPSLGQPQPTKATRTAKRSQGLRHANPDPLSWGQGSHNNSLVEPTGIEPATSCLQNVPEDIWKGSDLEDLYW
jgi:hypothetical protein